VKRQTRKNLKTDKFAEEVGHTFEFLSEHSSEAKRYGAIALVVIAAAAGYFYYSLHQATVRAEALAQTLRVDDATVGSNVQQANLHFDTEEQKAKARTKALTDTATKYHGTQEGAIAAFYLASDAADKGDMADAEKRYKDIMDSAPKAYASMARLALAQIYIGTGRNAEAETLLKYAIDHPTSTVSKEEATLTLAQLIAKTNPAEARKMLEPLRTQRAAVSRVAVELLGSLPPNAQ
jgi:predicted negative regulator of RcsB-dependent stress response